MTQIVGKYKIDLNCVVGKGAFATVYGCTCENSQMPLCVKIINLGAAQDRYDKTSMEREVKILEEIKAIHHPNIIKIHDIILANVGGSKVYYVFMDRCLQGHLEKVIKLKQKSKINFSTTEILEFLQQIVEGYSFLYSKSIIHRDLKPENLLMGNDGQIKISDFGMGKILSNEAKNTKQLQSQVGTPYFASPQVLMDGNYSPKADVYSLGIIVYYLTFQQLPYQATSFLQLQQVIAERLNGRLLALPSIVCQGSEQEKQKIKNFIQKTITYKEEDRIDWSEIFKIFIPNSQINSELGRMSSQSTDSSLQSLQSLGQPVGMCSNFLYDSKGQQKSFEQQKSYEVRCLISILMARQELAQMVEDHLRILENKFQSSFQNKSLKLLYASLSGYQQAISCNLNSLIENRYEELWNKLRDVLSYNSINLKCEYYFQDQNEKVSQQKRQVKKDEVYYHNKFQQAKSFDLKDFQDSHSLKFFALLSLEKRVPDYRIYCCYFQHFYELLIEKKFKKQFNTIQDIDTLKLFALARKLIFLEEEMQIQNFLQQQYLEITLIENNDTLDGLRNFIANHPLE